MILRWYLHLLVVLGVVSCAGSPMVLSRMTEGEIRNVDEPHLCRAYAIYKSLNEEHPNINAEVNRRGLNCTEELEGRVSDCSMLRLVSTAPHPRYSNVTIFTVQNLSPKRKSFRVSGGNISSETLRLEPLMTRSFAVVVSQGIGVVAAVVGALQGTTQRAPELYDCVTATFH